MLPEPRRKTTPEKREDESMKEQYSLQCGAAPASITPPVGTILFGYAPGWPSESVSDYRIRQNLAILRGAADPSM